jgi:hypothetical protein
MIPKSGHRFSEKIMLKQIAKARLGFHPSRFGSSRFGGRLRRAVAAAGYASCRTDANVAPSSPTWASQWITA